MNPTIDTQSQNEVKDLLNEYVVSPLNTGVFEQLKKVLDKIDDLEENTKEVQNNSSVGIRGEIIRLKGQVDEKIKDVNDSIDNIDSSFNDLSGVCKQIKENITQLVSVADKSHKLNEKISNNQTTLLTNTSEYYKQLYESFETLTKTLETTKENLQATVSKLQASVSEELGSFYNRISESSGKFEQTAKDNFSDIVKELHTIEELLNNQHDDLSAKYETALQKISTNIDEQNTTLINHHEETNTAIQVLDTRYKESSEKRYKTLFIISLSFGVANTIGIIVMILLFLLKV